MNYDAARQRTNGRWDYTTNGRAVGYCGGWNWADAYDPKKEWAFGSEDHYLRQKAAAEIYKDKYHVDGHASLEEACECYKQYMLDGQLQLDRRSSSSQHKCAVCEEWTQGIAGVGGWHIFILCDKHRNREEVAKLFTVGESWHS